MKLKEMLEIMELNGNQVVNVCWRDDNETLVTYAEYDGKNAIDEKYNDAEVLGIGLGVDKWLRPRIDVIIERVKTNKRYHIEFDIPCWIDLNERIELEFEDDEDEFDIRDAIEEAFEEWLDDKIESLKSEATKEVVEVEEY